MLNTKFCCGFRDFTNKLEELFSYVLIFPLVLALALFFFYPLVYAIMLSFQGKNGSFVGIANYIHLFNDRYFWHSLKLTFIYVIVYTGGVFFVGFITSLVMWKGERSNLPGEGILGAMITLPYAIPDIVASLMWLWILTPSIGVLNFGLKSLGITNLSGKWLGDPKLALYCVLLVTIWRLFPMHTLIILASFRSIPKEIFDAAEIDGATGIKEFFYITLPMTSSILVLLLLLTIVWSFKRFTILWTMTQGGPSHASETTVILLYREAFIYFHKNYACAIGTFMLIIVTLIALFCLKARKIE